MTMPFAPLAKLAKYFDKDLPLRARLFNAFGCIGTSLGVLAAASSVYTGAGFVHVGVNLLASVLALFLIWYANRTGRFERCYGITIVSVFFVFFTALFFTAGGYHSGLPPFFVFSVTFTAMMLRGKKRMAFVSAEIALYCGLCLAQYLRPDLVPLYASEWRVAFDIATGFVLASVALVFAMVWAFKAYDDGAAKLEASRLEAEVANEAKTDFLAKMSHEIRTPLNVINGMNETVARHAMPDQAKIAECCATARESLRALTCLIDGLLDISKIEHGSQKIENEDYSVPGLMRELSAIGETAARGRGLDFAARVSPDMPTALRGDFKRVKQIASNFLTNAAKYTKSGTITLCAEYAEPILRLSVSDTGIGIKPEDRGRIFEKFTQAAGGNGAGLGLAIAHELAALMGAEITVESEYGVGSEFTVAIPQTVADAAPVGGLSLNRPGVPAHKLSGRTAQGCGALIVDDNGANLSAAINLLSGTLLDVDTAESGEECVKKVKGALGGEGKYHVILMDYMMPGMDGIKTLERLKEEIPGFDVPVIALTADAISGAREMFMDAGFAGYLSKPYTPRDLEDAIFSLLPKDRVDINDGHDTERFDADESVAERYGLPVRDYLKLERELSYNGVILREGMKYAGGDIALFREYALSLLEKYETERGKAEKLIDSGDWGALAILLHSLKSDAGFVGAVDLSGAAEHARAACRAAQNGGDMESVKIVSSAMPRLYLEWGQTCRALPPFLEFTEGVAAGERGEDASGGFHKVLVIDDNESIHRVARATLKNRYEVVAASGGEAALRLIDGGNIPDVILLDIDMPGMDGYETLELLEENPASSDIPVIFLTGNDSTGDQARGFDSGAAGYIVKPFEPKTLISQIKNRIASSAEFRAKLEAQKSGAVLEIDEDKFEKLTSRLSEKDCEIARLMALGGTNKAIAAKLGYAPGTIKNKATPIFDQIGVIGRFELRKLVLRVKQK